MHNRLLRTGHATYAMLAVGSARGGERPHSMFDEQLRA